MERVSVEADAEKPFKSAGCPKNEANCNLLCKQKLGGESIGVCTGDESFCECFKVSARRMARSMGKEAGIAQSMGKAAEKAQTMGKGLAGIFNQ